MEIAEEVARGEVEAALATVPEAGRQRQAAELHGLLCEAAASQARVGGGSMAVALYVTGAASALTAVDLLMDARDEEETLNEEEEEERLMGLAVSAYEQAAEAADITAQGGAWHTLSAATAVQRLHEMNGWSGGQLRVRSLQLSSALSEVVISSVVAESLGRGDSVTLKALLSLCEDRGDSYGGLACGALFIARSWLCLETLSLWEARDRLLETQQQLDTAPKQDRRLARILVRLARLRLEPPAARS